MILSVQFVDEICMVGLRIGQYLVSKNIRLSSNWNLLHYFCYCAKLILINVYLNWERTVIGLKELKPKLLSRLELTWKTSK